MAISIQTLTNNFSFQMSLSQSPFFSTANPLAAKPPPPPFTVRMGGGPRTFPGGVSKWQWKRMQAKKAKQLLKARLCRERQIYEMRKRAELRAAVSELERPWEPISHDDRARAPTLLSVSADDQVKALADRFQRHGGFDMWTPRDGPQLFRSPADDLPSARFFPKGVVHSVKPYRREIGTGTGIAAASRVEDDDDAEVSDSSGGEPRRSYETRFGGRLPPPVDSSGVSNSTRNSPSGNRNGNRTYQSRPRSSEESSRSLNPGARFGLERNRNATRSSSVPRRNVENSERFGFDGNRRETKSNPSFSRRNERQYDSGSNSKSFGNEGSPSSSNSERVGFSRNRNASRNPSFSRINERKYNTESLDSERNWRKTNSEPGSYRRNERRYDAGNGSRNSSYGSRRFESGSGTESKVYDMSMQNNGSYGFR